MAEVDSTIAAAALLRERLSSGDDSVTASELLNADVEVERAKLLHDAAGRAVRRAQSSLVLDSTPLADCLVSVLAGLLPGIPVHAAADRPTAVADVPACYVVQSKPATADPYRGQIAGPLEVHLHRTAVYRDLTPEQVEQAAGRAGISLVARPMPSRNDGTTVIDSLAVTVHRAYAAEPVIADVQAWQVSHFGQALASAVSAGLQDRGWDAPQDGVRVGGSGGTRPSATVRVTATEASLASQTVDATGKRRVTVHVSLKALPGRGELRDFEDMAPAVRGQLARQVGSAVEGLGRVLALEVVDVEPAVRNSSRKSTGVSLTARVALVSRTVAARTAA